MQQPTCNYGKMQINVSSSFEVCIIFSCQLNTNHVGIKRNNYISNVTFSEIEYLTYRVDANAFHFVPLGIRAFWNINKNLSFAVVSKRRQLIFTERLANVVNFLFPLFF